MRGFTLIEVLVALAIVAVGMAAVLGTLNSSADTIVYLRDKTFANWVALNQIAQVRLAAAQGQTPATGDSEGNVDFADRNWTWHQTVSTTPVQGIERIDVSVRPSDVKVQKEDSGWYATASGIWGDAVGTPRGDLPNWGSQMLAPGTANGSQGAATTGGMTPGAFAPATTQPGTSTTPTTPAPANPTPLRNP